VDVVTVVIAPYLSIRIYAGDDNKPGCRVTAGLSTKKAAMPHSPSTSLQLLFPFFPLVCLTLLLCYAFGGAPGTIRGVVVDAGNAPVAEARLSVHNHRGVALRQAVTDATGSFELVALPVGSYALRIEARGFQAQTISLHVNGSEMAPLSIALTVAPVRAEVTVTVSRTNVESVQESAHLVSVRNRSDFQSRPLPTIGTALDNAPGVMARQTTAGQVSPHLRGLTGYQTLLLIDDVRLNTAIFRSGPKAMRWADDQPADPADHTANGARVCAAW
jgi:hypothetical protein